MGLFNKKEKSYDEIVNEIHSNLTDNKGENIKYLKRQAEKYKKHPMAREIIKEIGRLVTRNLDEKKLQELNNAIENNITSHLDNGIKYLENGDFNNAETELNKFIDISKVMFKGDRVYKYFTPRNPIEYMLILNDEKGKKFKETGTDFSIGYTYLGIIAVENKDFSKAREMLKQALRWNPYNTESIFEEVEIYKIEGKLEEYKDATLATIQKIYNPLDMARFYRNLGYYYIERQEWELAKAIHFYSMRFDNGEKAKHELIYIMQQTNSQELPKPELIKGILEKNYIPTKITERNLTILNEMTNEIKRDKQENSNLGQYLIAIMDFYNKL